MAFMNSLNVRPDDKDFIPVAIKTRQTHFLFNTFPQGIVPDFDGFYDYSSIVGDIHFPQNINADTERRGKDGARACFTHLKCTFARCFREGCFCLRNYKMVRTVRPLL